MPRQRPDRTAPAAMRGFTLIELLIVIAIIGIIASIGLPAIVKASERAGEIQCIANVRSAVQATTAYLTDNRQIFPDSETNLDLHTVALFGKPGINAGFRQTQTPAQDRPLFRYLNGETKVAECPLDQGSSAVPPSTGENNFNYLGSSYIYPNRANTNFRQRNNVWALEGHRLTAVQQPSKKLLLADHSLWVPPGIEQNQWHEPIGDAQSASIGFVDGHVSVQAAKVDNPTESSWTRYTVLRYLNTNAAQIETWATQDAYY